MWDAPDYTTTFSISHPGDNGVVTIGTRDWDDYTVSSELTLVHQRTAWRRAATWRAASAWSELGDLGRRMRQ